MQGVTEELLTKLALKIFTCLGVNRLQTLMSSCYCVIIC